MKIAVTGGAGFIGSHLARQLIAGGHEVVIVSRRPRPFADKALIAPVGLGSVAALQAAFADCDAVAHCAGINREIGRQTYAEVHVEGTRRVVEAARLAGVKKLVYVSFLRARAQCGSPYHESKFAAEEIIRASGMDYTVVKPGVVYGRGDHMLDHLSHAFHSFPLFAFVGLKDQLIRPTAVEDIALVLQSAVLIDPRLEKKTVAVVGPETLTLREAVQRVATVVQKSPIMFRMPLWFHYAFAWVLERVMTIPLISTAQVRILSEGIVEAAPACEALPEDLQPRTHFTERQIRRGLPEPKPFQLSDFRCCFAAR